MILRRITEHVNAQNWFAIGLDFLIVVVGVFIGIPRYRQSPEFKQRIRDSGVHDYWRKAGFPKQCQPVEPDDFRCDLAALR